MRRTTSATSLLVVALGLAGAAEGKTLRWAFQGDIATLDPYAHTESFTSNVLHHVYEPLVRRGLELQIEPALAVAWELVEPTVWRFTLRDGVVFHNGSPLTADDVVVSLRRLMHPDARAKGNLLAVAEVRKVDDKTVEIVTKGPYPLLLNDLNGIYVMDAEWLQANDAVLPGNITTGRTTFASTNANGTGPFILESFRPDQKTVMVVNPKWWDEAQHNLTRIEFSPIKSDATRVAALLSGEVDLMFPAPLQDVARINGTPGFKALETPTLRTIFFGMSQKDPELHDSDVKGANPLKDARVRRALWQAIDTDLLNQRIMRGKARVAGLLVAPAIPGWSKEADVRPPHDVDAARRLLAEAGYPQGFRTNLSCSNDRYVNDEQICVAVASMWARIGVKANLVAESKTTYFPKVDRGETDIYILGWATLPQMDGFNVLSALLATRQGSLGNNNAGGVSHPRIDAIVSAAATELDAGKRLALVTEGLTIARDQTFYIPLHQQPQTWGVRDGVEVVQFPDEYVRLWHARVN